MLKTPHHLRQMDVLFKVFPGTRVIQTHRDPLQTIPSIASFTFNLWKVYMAQPDPMRAGRQWSAIFARGVRESMRFRDSSSPARFCDVWLMLPRNCFPVYREEFTLQIPRVLPTTERFI